MSQRAGQPGFADACRTADHEVLALTDPVTAREFVEQRAIQTSSISGDKWIVSSGLNAGDRVIVEGLQKVRAGAPVTAVPSPTGNTNTPVKSSAAAANP